MSAVQSAEATDTIVNGTRGVKRGYILHGVERHLHSMGLTKNSGRRRSTILNPRTYVKDDLWRQAPVLTGSTKFEPLPDAKNILITGGAGFMYVNRALKTQGAASTLRCMELALQS
jgi:hypothetical protein